MKEVFLLLNPKILQQFRQTLFSSLKNWKTTNSNFHLKSFIISMSQGVHIADIRGSTFAILDKLSSIKRCLRCNKTLKTSPILKLHSTRWTFSSHVNQETSAGKDLVETLKSKSRISSVL